MSKKKISVGDSQEFATLVSFQIIHFMVDKSSEDVTSCLEKLLPCPCLPNDSVYQTPHASVAGMLRSEKNRAAVPMNSCAVTADQMCKQALLPPLIL